MRSDVNHTPCVPAAIDRHESLSPVRMRNDQYVVKKCRDVAPKCLPKKSSKVSSNFPLFSPAHKKLSGFIVNLLLPLRHK